MFFPSSTQTHSQTHCLIRKWFEAFPSDFVRAIYFSDTCVRLSIVAQHARAFCHTAKPVCIEATQSRQLQRKQELRSRALAQPSPLHQHVMLTVQSSPMSRAAGSWSVVQRIRGGHGRHGDNVASTSCAAHCSCGMSSSKTNISWRVACRQWHGFRVSPFTKKRSSTDSAYHETARARRER